MSRKIRIGSVILLILSLVIFGCSNSVLSGSHSIARSASLSTDYSFAAMAPLYVSDWSSFESQLDTAKSMGIEAISVDVWWGDVEENGDQQFDWSYYDTIFGKIRNAGLDIVPIMSFHQCGGNVGDDYTSYLPSWIWTHFSGVSSDNLKYRSETGAYSTEYVSLWGDDYVIDEYIEFMDAFETQYGDMASDIDELNISGGPSGELRYPSYNSHDWGGYPNRGTLQCYGDLAISDFRTEILAKYGSLSSVNSAWGISLASVDKINVPDDSVFFFDNYDYNNIQYGKDFIDWYNQSLSDHGKRLINAAKTAFNNEFSSIELGMKIPGIHWRMGDPDYPRLAEITAGLIQTSVDYENSSTGHGYNNIVSTFTGNNRQVNLHFTCLEMGNENWSPAYSKAKDLVFWVASAADSQGVTIKGENALSGGVTTNFGWDQIENAFKWTSYSGLTVLRLGNIVSDIGKTRYEKLINTYGDQNTTDLVIHFSEWESASTYILHPWDGLSSDLNMTYEGYISNAHWWELTVNDKPDYFKFCFTNSNGNWDGINRTYSNQSNEIYIKPYDSMIYTSRP